MAVSGDQAKLEAVASYVNNIHYVDLSVMSDPVAKLAGKVLNRQVSMIVVDILRILEVDEPTIAVGNADGSQVYDIFMSDYIRLVDISHVPET